MQYCPETIPYASKRYIDETRRLYHVLEKRLEGRDWLVGSKYSLADIKALPWLMAGFYAKVDAENTTEFPNLSKWLARCQARPATAVS